jgi:short-subunit dehydrogenase
MSLLQGKRIIITGASSGIGAALARECARRGAHVGMLARRENELLALVRELRGNFPGEIFAYQVADVGEESDLQIGMDSLIRQLDGLDIAVANSGRGKSLSSFSSHQWENARETLRVNLLGAIHTLEIAKDYFVKQRRGGKLVGISSIAAVRGFPRSSAYCASKAGLSSYMEGMRGELSTAGIEVLSIQPGFIRTSMTSGNKTMPFLMEVDESARRIANAMESGKSRYIFPFPMRIIFTLLKHMPDVLYDRLTRVRRIASGRRIE